MSEQDDDELLAILRWHPRYRSDVESLGQWAADSLARLLTDERAVVSIAGDETDADIIAPAKTSEKEVMP